LINFVRRTARAGGKSYRPPITFWTEFFPISDTIAISSGLLGSRQDVFGSRTIIDAAGLLYLDELGNPIRGATSRDRKGVVRRVADIANQLGLTYDLRTCPVPDFLNLLPPEFERWVREHRKRGSKEARNAASIAEREGGAALESRA
jgi:hypothetical protein